MKSVTRKIFISFLLLMVIFSIILLLIPSPERAIRANNIVDPILNSVVNRFADSIDANPKMPKPRMQLGMTYEGAGLYELAEKTYSQYIELFPEKVIGWYRHAVVCNRLGQIDKAIASLESAVNIAKSEMDSPHWQLSFWYIDIGEIEKAKQQIDIAATKKPNTVQVLIARARIALEEEDYQQAVTHLTSPQLTYSLSSGYVNQLLGRAYLGLGEKVKAEEAWAKATMGKPKWADPWTKLVIEHAVGLNVMRQKIAQLLKSNQFIEARKLINEYFVYDQSNRVVRRLDASCDAREGNPTLAIKKFSALLKEQPKDTVTMLLLAKLRMQIIQFQNPNGNQRTRELLLNILEMTPDNIQAQLLLDEINDR